MDRLITGSKKDIEFKKIIKESIVVIEVNNKR